MAADPVVSGLVWLGIGPDALTMAGCVLSIASGMLFFEGSFQIAAGVLALSGLCDVLDGQVARRMQKVSRFGAFLDSTLDRVAEGAVLIGLSGFYFMHLHDLAHDPAQVLEEVARGLEPRTWAVLALTAMLALLGSFLVSYTRARAEGLGIECKVGWFERPERLVLLMVAGAFGVGPVMPGALILLTLLSFATATQRVAHVWRETRSR
jgi:CDP-diacylglycerol--glycerol-3-phosphate 3-phosphatidyltransferase